MMTAIHYFSRCCGLAEWVLGWFHQVLMRLHLAEGSTGLGESKVMSALLKDGSGYWLLCFPFGLPGGSGGKEPAYNTGDSG